MNQKDLSGILIVIRMKFQKNVGSRSQLLLGSEESCWHGKEVNFSEDQRNHVIITLTKLPACFLKYCFLSYVSS